MEENIDAAVGDAAQPNIKSQIKDIRFWVVLVLASQYFLFQLIWPVEYQDAPRNLHWGIYLTEEPRFLLDAEDTYDHAYGFVPDDLSLAPAGLARDSGNWFHGWWGPLYPAIIASLWIVSGSYTPLELFTPACAGLVVILTYLFGANYFNRRIGFTAALLMGLTPVFREHAVLAYTEPVGALLLLAAFWSHLRRKGFLTAIFGSLCVLMKLDLMFIYIGTVGLTEWIYWREHRQGYRWQHIIASLGIPGVFAGAWLVLNYGIISRPVTVLGSPGISHLIELAPKLIDQFFTTIPLLTYLTLGVLALCLVLGLVWRDYAESTVYQMLSIWTGLGVAVVLVYMLFPGASNNPRILIPAFPALFLLASAGINQIAVPPRMLVESYLVVILVIMSTVGGLYQVIYSEEHQATMPVWGILKDDPKGYVMTAYFWHANLYARQPATWFFGDPVYEHNVMHNLDHFQNYLDMHPIRYVVLPREDDPSTQLRSPRVQIYQALGIGRKLTLRSEAFAGEQVRAYLEREYTQIKAGDYVIFRMW